MHIAHNRTGACLRHDIGARTPSIEPPPAFTKRQASIETHTESQTANKAQQHIECTSSGIINHILSSIIRRASGGVGGFRAQCRSQLSRAQSSPIQPTIQRSPNNPTGNNATRPDPTKPMQTNNETGLGGLDCVGLYWFGRLGSGRVGSCWVRLVWVRWHSVA